MNGALKTCYLRPLTPFPGFAWANGKPSTPPWKPGGLLTQAKGRLQHGEWGDWLGRVGLAPRTARTWMKIASMDLTAEDVIERGGINAAAQGRGKTASEADLPDIGLDRDLASAEASIADTKAAYYAALSRRNAALRALARERPRGG